METRLGRHPGTPKRHVSNNGELMGMGLDFIILGTRGHLCFVEDVGSEQACSQPPQIGTL